MKITAEMIDVAVNAYDAARCEVHGKTVAQEGMSDKNKETIRPMIQAAITAAILIGINQK